MELCPTSEVESRCLTVWRLNLFGKVCLRRDGQAIDSFGTVRAAKLLVLLSLTRSGRMHREQLAELLWPEDFYDATRLRLRQEIHRLKRALGVAEALIGSSTTEVWIDRSEFETQLEVLDRASCKKLDEPLPVQEEFLPGWDDIWVMPERLRAEQVLAQAGIAEGVRMVADGNPQAALDFMRPLIEAHPLNEELRKTAVSAHAALGNITAAVAEYQSYRRLVKDRLGIEAPDEMESLLQQFSKPIGSSAAVSAVAPALTDWSATIPIPTDVIFGRGRLLQQLEEALTAPGKPRLTTLVGPGGIGKTRLATEVAQRLSEGGTVRVAFASLAEVSEPELWAREVLAQLRIDPPAEADAVHYLVSTLADAPTILVLDNLETVLPEAADQIAKLVAGSRTLRVLATSVTPARVPGEAIVTVGPLEIGEAGSLMLDAFRTHKPTATVTGDIERDLETIAQRLDGYPLALRLAAARLRLLPPGQLLSQLDSAVSRSSAADIPARHLSLDSALASSYQSLGDAERDALRRIAAYPGGMGMELAAIEFADEPYLDLFEALLDTALVTLDDHGEHARVRLLAPVRRFVRKQLGEEEAIDFERRYVTRSLQFLEGFDLAPWRPLSFDHVHRIEPEADNILPAWRWALANEPDLALRTASGVIRFESSRGRSLALMELLDSSRNTWANADFRIRMELELGLAQLCFSCHRDDRAREPLDRAAEIAGEVQDKELAAAYCLCEAQYSWRREFASTQSKADQLADLATTSGFRYLLGRSHRLHAAVCDYRAEYQECIHHLQQALALFTEVNAQTETTSVQIYLAAIQWYVGQKEEALKLMEETRVIVANLRDPVIHAQHLEVEGRFFRIQGDFAEGEVRFRETLRLWQAMDSAYQEADQHHSLAHCLIGQERWPEAARHTIAAAEHWYEDSNLGGMCCTLVHLAIILLQVGKTDEAKRIIAFARDLEKEHSLVLVQAELVYREEFAEKIGGAEKHAWPLTLDQAKLLFDLIPRASLVG